ncbi:hypothetical protein GIB67_014732 [Kingdonia uniflora]|uniref:Uncharacterized protein n=1 Tax=Kingdonia uniflora TaxID=39325 RepID=A0A7J7NUM9_9MAGN|nr:hypothetical protein GIB67_014732 [Kingdonia uniflora]
MASSTTSQPLVMIQPLEGDMSTDGNNTIPLSDVLKASIHHLFWCFAVVRREKGYKCFTVSSSYLFKHVDQVGFQRGVDRFKNSLLGEDQVSTGSINFPGHVESEGLLSIHPIRIVTGIGVLQVLLDGLTNYMIASYILLVARLSVTTMTRLAAEGLEYDIKWCKPQISKEQQLNLTRWAVLLAGSLLKNNKVAHEALMSSRHICDANSMIFAPSLYVLRMTISKLFLYPLFLQ